MQAICLSIMDIQVEASNLCWCCLDSSFLFFLSHRVVLIYYTWQIGHLENGEINVTYINDIGAPVFTGSSSIADFLISSSGGGINTDGFIFTKGWSMMVCFMAIRNFSAMLMLLSCSCPLSSSSSSASASAFSSSSWLWLGTCSIKGCSCLDVCYVCYVYTWSCSSKSSKSLLDSVFPECFDEITFWSS